LLTYITMLQVAEAMVQAMAMEDDERAKRHSNMSRYAKPLIYFTCAVTLQCNASLLHCC
jgi:hypothetical protein